MVIQRTLDNLKDQPHDEKKVVASGIAITVVVILLVVWAFLFIKKIQRGNLPQLEGGALPQDQLDAAFIEQTRQQIQEYNQSSEDQYRDLRDTSADNQVRSSYEQTDSVGVESDSNDFGAQQSDF